MKDIQSTPSPVALSINSVGIRGIKFPIQIQSRTLELQYTVAVVDMGVDLSAFFRGTHMSRFVEILQDWSEPLSYESLERLIRQTQSKLHTSDTHITFFFPYFIKKKAPVTGLLGLTSYDCKILGKTKGKDIEFSLELTVPVMTVCPCSKEISSEGAHSQRSNIHVKLKVNTFSMIEDIIDMAETSASSPLYSLLKRADEKSVTETAFANPTFVEDVVRNMSNKLIMNPYVFDFSVEVESFESIHSHNAFAYIEHQKVF